MQIKQPTWPDIRQIQRGLGEGGGEGARVLDRFEKDPVSHIPKPHQHTYGIDAETLKLI